MKTVLIKLRITLLLLLAVMTQSVWAEEAAPPGEKLGAPQHLVAECSAHSIALHWDAVASPNVKEYWVFRYTIRNGGVEKVEIAGKVNANHFMDRGVEVGGEYGYQVAAITKAFVAGERSKAVGGFLQKYTPPALKSVQTEVAEKQIKMRWKPIESEFVNSYIIYQKDGDAFTKIGETVTTEFIKDGLTPSTKYTYYVAANGSDGIEAEKFEVSATTSDKLDISNVAAQIVWGKKRDHNLVAHYDPQSQLYWTLPVGIDPTKLPQDEFECYDDSNSAAIQAACKIPRRRMNSYDDARTFATNLIIDGQVGWHFPSVDELRKSSVAYTFKTGGAIFVRDKKWPNRWHPDQFDTCDLAAYSLTAGQFRKESILCERQRPDTAYYVDLVRSRSHYDEIIEAANKSSDERLSELTALLLAKKLTVITPAMLTAPVAQQPITANRLDKGEFETTEAFQKRTEAENERVRTANEAAQRSYDVALKKYEEAVAAQQRELAAMTKHNQEPEVVHAAFVVALSEAMTMMYGDPVLVDFKYDADKQTFSGTLKSEKGGFNRAVEFAVPLSKAAQVKAQLTDTSLIPQITFKAKGTELAFAKLDIIDNVIKQQQEFALAKSANTIEAYEKFLKQNPTAPQTGQAQQGISALQAAAERERLAAIKYAQQRQREAAAQARAEAAQYGKRKNAGDRVCLNGSAAFGLVHFKVTGYVEQVSGNRIQIRISDTEGQSARYNNVDLYQNTVLWDNFNQWRACD